jgi:hypothetical protein
MSIGPNYGLLQLLFVLALVFACRNVCLLSFRREHSRRHTDRRAGDGGGWPGWRSWSHDALACAFAGVDEAGC